VGRAIRAGRIVLRFFVGYFGVTFALMGLVWLVVLALSPAAGQSLPADLAAADVPVQLLTEGVLLAWPHYLVRGRTASRAYLVALVAVTVWSAWGWNQLAPSPATPAGAGSPFSDAYAAIPGSGALLLVLGFLALADAGEAAR